MHKNDYLWKGILEDIFEDFLRFVYPDADKFFDFTRNIEFLDKELEQLFPPEKDKSAVKIVDKLARVYTHKGTEKWVLIHCEVQGEYKSDFPRRMYTYFYRIFDKYGKHISAYAILTEKSTKPRTNSYTVEFLGTKLEYRYNVYKISQQSEDELLRSDNPFAMAVLIARSVLSNKRLDDSSLMEIKKRLAKELFKKLYPKEKIYHLLTFLISYIHFENEENNLIFEENLDQITGRTKTMGIVEMVIAEKEERAMERGIERGIERGMEQGIERRNREVVINMLRKNFSDDVIADVAEVSPEYVQKIKSTVV
jgi:hypothetical protein